MLLLRSRSDRSGRWPGDGCVRVSRGAVIPRFPGAETLDHPNDAGRGGRRRSPGDGGGVHSVAAGCGLGTGGHRRQRLLGRDDHLRGRLRRRGGRLGLRRLQVQGAPGRHGRRQPDPRAHRPRDRLDADPDHPRHGHRHLLGRRPRPVGRRACGPPGRRGARRAVRLDVHLPGHRGRGRQAAHDGRARPAHQPDRPVRHHVRGRHPLLLGARVADEAGRRPGHHDAHDRRSRPSSGPSRSSAPSFAASATRRCVRRRSSSPRPTSRPG